MSEHGPPDSTSRSAPADAATSSALGWLVATVALLGVVAMALLVGSSEEFSDNATIIVGTSLLTIYAGVRLAGIVARGELRPLIATFWLFCFTALGCAPLAQAALQRYPLLQDRSYIGPATAILALGIVCWDIAYNLAPRLRTVDTTSRDVERLRPVSERRLLALAVVGVAGAAYYVQSVGVSTLFASRNELTGELVESGLRGGDSNALSGIVLAFGQVPVFVAFAGLTCLLIRRADRRRLLSLQVGWAALLLVNVLVNNPVSNPRNWVITMALGLLFALPRLGPWAFRWTVVGAAVAALVIFPYSDYFRVQSSARQDIQFSSVTSTVATKDFDQLIMSANGMWWVDARGGHTGGGQALGAALFFVPRAVWPDKPIDTGVEIGRAIRSPNTNLSSPLWIEAWVDFGIAGVVLVFSGLGVLARRADDLFLRARSRLRHRVLVVDLAIPAVAAYEFILLRGPLLQAMARLSVLLLVYWFLRGRRCEPETADGPGKDGGAPRRHGPRDELPGRRWSLYRERSADVDNG